MNKIAGGIAVIISCVRIGGGCIKEKSERDGRLHSNAGNRSLSDVRADIAADEEVDEQENVRTSGAGLWRSCESECNWKGGVAACVLPSLGPSTLTICGFRKGEFPMGDCNRRRRPRFAFGVKFNPFLFLNCEGVVIVGFTD